jgi:hypothetical protein
VTPRIRVLAWIYLVQCGGLLAVGTFVCVGLFLSRDRQSANALFFIGPGFLAVAVIYLIPGFVGGLGLLRGQPWARIVIIVLSLPVLPLFPVGTALGGFGLWTLLGADAIHFTGAPSGQPPSKAPPAVARSSEASSSRYAGLLMAMAGVAALFVVAIGTGFRVTGSPAPSIIDGAYWGSIVVLLVLIAVAVGAPALRRWRGARGEQRGQWDGGLRRELGEHRPEIEEAEHTRGSTTTPSGGEPHSDTNVRLRERIGEFARLLGAPDHALPTLGCSEQTGRPHIEVDGTTFHYAVVDRGREYERHSTASLDELLYWVFRDVTFSMAATRTGLSQLTPASRRRILRDQLALLGRLDPAWEKRRAAEG